MAITSAVPLTYVFTTLTFHCTVHLQGDIIIRCMLVLGEPYRASLNLQCQQECLKHSQLEKVKTQNRFFPT